MVDKKETKEFTKIARANWVLATIFYATMYWHIFSTDNLSLVTAFITSVIYLIWVIGFGKVWDKYSNNPRYEEVEVSD